jgi:hypothetical protein
MNEIILKIKSSKNYNKLELDFLLSRFTKKELMIKLIELEAGLFERDCNEILKKRGMRY